MKVEHHFETSNQVMMILCMGICTSRFVYTCICICTGMGSKAVPQRVATPKSGAGWWEGESFHFLLPILVSCKTEIVSTSRYYWFLFCFACFAIIFFFKFN